jgi:hypothetical protein
VEWLRRLHRSHRPEIGPYSICMHRDDAATVSYTEIVVSRGISRMRYESGPTCKPTAQSISSLETNIPDSQPIPKDPGQAIRFSTLSN